MIFGQAVLDAEILVAVGAFKGHVGFGAALLTFHLVWHLSVLGCSLVLWFICLLSMLKVATRHS